MKQKIIYIAGFRQHAGKTITSLGLISALSKHFSPDEIGYIKPVGQEMFTLPDGKKVDKDARIIQKFCLPDLDMDYVSPVKIASGVTKSFLSSDNKEAITAEYIKSIKEAIESLKDKKIIIAEGTGHPGVGSIVGLSNEDVCQLIGAEIVYLAGGGLGKSLDMLTTDLTFFASKGAEVKGIIFNKLIPEKIESMQSLLTEKLLATMYSDFKEPMKIFGFLPSIQYLNKPSMKLIVRKFKESTYIGESDEKAWERPCNRVKIISLPHKLFKPEEHLKPHDVVILTASSQRRLSKILKFNEQLKDKLCGLILTCSGNSKTIPSGLKQIRKYNIPAAFVNKDTAETDEIINRCIENTKLQPYDDYKIQYIKNLFEKHFDIEKFMKSYGIDAKDK